MKLIFIFSIVAFGNLLVAQNAVNDTLVQQLKQIYLDDQTYRHQLDSVQKNFGGKSQEMKDLWEIIKEKDSINLIKIEEILDKYGWLGSDEVGETGNAAIFLVIQHANLTAQEKYLPLMREAVKTGKAKSGSLALLEDRVALRHGKRQIYGSQVAWDMQTDEYYVLPLEDPDNVDIRRKEVGLGTLGEYVANWGLVWDVEEYKRKLPEYEEKQKKKSD